MSEVPSLRAAVRASAERRYGRRRRPVLLRLAPVVALAAVALAALAIVTRGERVAPPTGEIAATPTADAPAETAKTLADARRALARVYAVFARPARTSDRPTGDVSELIDQGPSLPPIELDLANARRLATDGPRALYAVPGLQNDQIVLCTFIWTGGGAPGSGGCGPFSAEQAKIGPTGARMTARPAAVYSLIVRDGIDTVTLHLTSGKTRTARVQENAVLFQVKGLSRISWVDDGVERYRRYVTDRSSGDVRTQRIVATAPIPSGGQVGMIVYRSRDGRVCPAAGVVKDGLVGRLSPNGFYVLNAGDAPGQCGDIAETLATLGGTALGHQGSSTTTLDPVLAIAYGLLADRATRVRVTWRDGRSELAHVTPIDAPEDLQGAQAAFIVAGRIGTNLGGARLDLLRPDGTRLHRFRL